MASARMTTPSTPTRLKGPGEVSRGSRTQPSRLHGTANATASPQVKAALAAMRKMRLDEMKQRQAQQQHSTLAFEDDQQGDNASNSAEGLQIDVFTSGAGSQLSTRGSRAAETASPSAIPPSDEEGEDLVQWGGKKTSMLINEAKRTGRLNLSSRALTRVPQAVYTALIHSSSQWYPIACEGGSPPTESPQVDLTFGGTSNDSDAVAWYEQTELTSLALSNNEIDLLEDAIAGFENLQILDVHNNLLTIVPSTLINLINLTTLDLASNHLTEFPYQITNLIALRELDLSSNKLKTLWTQNWKSRLSKVLRESSSNHLATSRRDHGNAFYESFPSSPIKKATTSCEQVSTGHGSAPWPNLITLKVGGNPLDRDLLSRPGFEFPRTLRTLDMSACYLDENEIPLKVVGQLRQLRILRMTDCGFHNMFCSDQDEHHFGMFSSLQELDLSRNELNSLDRIDALFHSRRLDYIGVDRSVSNLIKSRRRLLLAQKTSRTMDQVDSDEEDEEEAVAALKIFVWKNPLKDEQGRRRRELASLLDELEGCLADSGAKESVPCGDRAEVLPNELERIKLQSPPCQPEPSDSLGVVAMHDQEDEETEASLEDEETEASLEDEETEASLEDDAVKLVTAALVRATRTVNLASRSLDSLATPDTGRPPNHLSSIRSLDLSRNAFTSVPLGSIISWSWETTLTQLDLSRNKLDNAHLPSTDCSIVMPNLIYLDLSWNSFISPSDGTSIFDFVVKFAPNVRQLDLSHNKLTSLSGVSLLLLGSGSSKPTIETLSVSANKLADVQELCRIGETIESRTGQLGPMWMRNQWTLRVLDLGDNDIARLPPSLGLLPHSLVLHLTGNKFRVPKREMYDNPSERLVLPWLKERL
ncbi:hypothetical protein OIV83_003393 [Microbotryomycetes sp. JL201]|nr:hypothetical protein OIV83_003393 [Microbotryomycetes sp. JL201]